MRTRVFAFALVAALLPGAAAAQTTTDKASQLLQIMADQTTGGGTAEVTVGALAPDVPKVPLPKADIIGTISGKATGQLATLVGTTYHLYYVATDGQIKSYAEALKAAGWAPSAMLGRGGFVSNGPGDVTMYCHGGSPAITTLTSGDSAQQLQVSISSGSAADTICSGGASMMKMMKAFSPSLDAPLPTLHAPQGSQMQAELATASIGRTAARITSSANAQALLGDFAAQFTDSGWSAGSKTTGDGIASQTFSHTDAQKHVWECALMIYTVNGKSGTYLAFIDPIDVTATVR